MAQEIERLNVVFDARFDRLEEKLNKVIRSNYGAAAQIEKRWKTANDNTGRGLDSLVNGRLKGLSGQINGVAASSGVGAAALSAFGVAGVVATTAIAGATIAVQGMWSALKFADDLVATATKLGIFSDELQALQYAAAEADVSNEALTEGLSGLNAALGKFQSGVGSAKISKVFAKLGLTRADVAEADNAAELLPMIADRISALQTTAEQTSVAKALGIEALLPLLRKGGAEIEAMTDKAHDLGLVMDRDLAQGAADAHRKLELLGGVVGSKITIAFAQLAESIIGPIDNVDVLIGKFNDMEAAARRNLRAVASWFRATADVVDAQTKLPWGREIETGLEKWLRDRAAMIEKVAAFGEGPKPRGRRGGSGTPQGDGFRGGYNRYAGAPDGDDAETKRTRKRAAATREATKTAEDYDEALKRLYVQLGDEGQQATARMQERLAMLREGFEKGQYTAAEVAKAIRMIDEELERLGFDDRVAKVVQSVDLQEDPFKGKVIYRGEIMDEAAAEDLRRKTRDAFRDGLEALRYEGADGVMRYLADSFSKRLLDRLADQLAVIFDQMMGQGGGGGWVSALTSLIPGFATGTNFAPGGLAVVGEHGRELVNLPRGAQVIPNHRVQAMARARVNAPAPVVMAPVFHLHADGAVMTEELMASFDARARRHAGQAYASAVTASRKGFAALNQRQQLLGTS